MSNRFPTPKLPFRRPKVRDRESVMLKHFTYRKMGHIHSPIESGHAFLKKIASSVKFCCYYGLLLLTIFFRGKVHLHLQLTQVAPTLVSLAAVFWMSRNAPRCERDYSHPRPGSLRVYQIRFRFFIFLHYFKRLLQNLQYNKIHKSSKVKCAQRPK